jgi:hydrogenase-4 component E
MEITTNSLMVLALLLNFLALGFSQIGTVIRIVAFQGVLLAVMPLWLEGTDAYQIGLLCLATAVIKGVLIPSMLYRAMRDVKIRREVEPLLGFIPSMLLGALGLVAGLVFSKNLPMYQLNGNTLILPVALSTILSGFIMMTTRQKAIMQVVGFLILENGIYIFGLLLMQTMPTLVELGVLLDLFVCIFVLGIILNHIQRAFSSLDSNKLTTLREKL